MLKQESKSHIIAFVGTVIVGVLVFLFLWFYMIYLHEDNDMEEQGIEVAFAEMPEMELPLPYQAEEGADGSSAAEGEVQPAPQTPAAQPTPADVARPVPPQEATKAPIAQQTESPVKQQPQEQEDKAAKAAAEAKARAEAAAKAKADSIARVQAEKIAKAQKTGALFGKGSGGAGGTGGQATTGSSGTGSNPATGKGSGKDGNGSWNLAGRDIVGHLPKIDSQQFEEGVVVVQIRVNAAGEVVAATETTGTTVGDQYTINLAKEAARKAKFSKGENDQIGSIKYTFKVR